jgi:hypothetical protein
MNTNPKQNKPVCKSCGRPVTPDDGIELNERYNAANGRPREWRHFTCMPGRERLRGAIADYLARKHPGTSWSVRLRGDDERTQLS